MESPLNLKFKIASEKWEFEQIYKLNYETFVEEIPQHQSDPTKILIDRFDKQNTYIICLKGKQLLGMISVCNKRPFSLDEKLKNLYFYLPRGRSICEIRLLSVDKEHRHGIIIKGLINLLYHYCKCHGYELAIISGIVEQLKLYENLGFVPFGPLVGTDNAKFQPMYLTIEAFENRCRDLIYSSHKNSVNNLQFNFLPGPVKVSQHVKQMFSVHSVSHRSEVFIQDFSVTKNLLRQLVNSKYVEIFMGSGTLANDVIAGQLFLNQKRGLILSNGEFGNRLINHATKFGLQFEILQREWGGVFKREDIELILNQNSNIKWLWVVHCETSTGILNDIQMLKQICIEREIFLCLDGISSIGTVPVDLSKIYMASCVSGKGLRSYPGLSMVFYNRKVFPSNKLPVYLDLGYYAANNGIPFTILSNLVYSLKMSLETFESEGAFNNIASLSQWLRHRLREFGYYIIAPDAYASPGVITIELPAKISSKKLGSQLENLGYFISYNSAYLLKRNWIQICLMGECSRNNIESLLGFLTKYSQLK